MKIVHDFIDIKLARVFCSTISWSFLFFTFLFPIGFVLSPSFRKPYLNYLGIANNLFSQIIGLVLVILILYVISRALIKSGLIIQLSLNLYDKKTMGMQMFNRKIVREERLVLYGSKQYGDDDVDKKRQEYEEKLKKYYLDNENLHEDILKDFFALDWGRIYYDQDLNYEEL